MTAGQPHAGEAVEEIHVLHVEDDPDFGDLTRTCLQHEDERIRVEAAGDPEEGLARLAEGEYDCIVSDYDMPGMNGVEFLEAIREERPDLPVILFTGKGSEEVASEAITAGVTDYLQKTGGISQFTVLANRVENAVEQHRSKRALEESQQRLSLFVEQSPLGVIEWDEEFDFIRLNDAAEEILGFSTEELAGDSWERIVPESDREDVATVVDELLDARGGYHSINENVRADGERIVCEWHNRVVTAGDEIVAVFSQFQDVTDRREHRQQLETVIDNLPGFVYRHRDEPGWPLEFVKGSAEDVLGYTAAELEAEVTLAEDVIHPDDREYVRTETETQLDERGRYDLTYRTVTKDDEVRWVRERGKLVTDPVTGEARLEGFITDVTDQKEREHELRRSTARLQALFEESPAMINVHDGEGNIIDPNPRLCEKTGYSEAELTEMTVWDLDRTADPDEVTELWAGMDTGDQMCVEGVYRRRDGSTFPVEVHVRRLDFDGADRFVVISRDVTGHRERERELRAERDRLDEFASVLSHDLRNPLNVAELQLELAADECDSDHLDDAAVALERIGTLIENLLALAREGVVVSDVAPVDGAALAGTCWSTVETEDADLEVEDGWSVRADRSRLRQLLENLLRNSVEHGEGDVTITVGPLEDGFYVEDDGPGIPGDERERVFETGYSTREGGTGFGLAIVEQIADAHGWVVHATDGADGARFEVTGVDRCADER